MMSPPRSADYTDPAVFEAERERLFARSWIPVCRADQLAAPGDQRAVEVAGVEVLLVRDLAGAVTALSNVCRHRAALLVTEPTCAKAIKCPYHLWTYGLDGRLLAAPFMEGADLTGLDLAGYAATEWCGWILVNLDPDATLFSKAVADLTPRFAARGLADWKIGWEMTFDSRWNWKVMVENFAESYHHIGPHAQSLQPFWPGGASDPSASTESWIELRHLRRPMLGTFTVYVVFPTLLFALSEPGDMAIWYRLTPKSVDRFELSIIGLFSDAALADSAAVAAAESQLRAIHLEDIPMCERVQAGLTSRSAILGPLSPLESGLASFHAYLAALEPRALSL